MAENSIHEKGQEVLIRLLIVLTLILEKELSLKVSDNVAKCEYVIHGIRKLSLIANLTKDSIK
jgi:hypothetical protein